MTSATARARAAKRRLPLPGDIKADIAEVVRSIELEEGHKGECLFRAAAGFYALALSGIPARVVLGGLLYRVGPDEHDLLAFCGPNSAGAEVGERFQAHYFLITDAGDLVDFAVGDWKAVYAEEKERWTIDPPQFHWDAVENFLPRAGSCVPELGQAWYTDYQGARSESDLFLKYAVEDNRMFFISRLIPLLKARNIQERIARK
jgi:hypothetical protein